MSTLLACITVLKLPVTSRWVKDLWSDLAFIFNSSSFQWLSSNLWVGMIFLMLSRSFIWAKRCHSNCHFTSHTCMSCDGPKVVTLSRVTTWLRESPSFESVFQRDDWFLQSLFVHFHEKARIGGKTKTHKQFCSWVRIDRRQIDFSYDTVYIKI